MAAKKKIKKTPLKPVNQSKTGKPVAQEPREKFSLNMKLAFFLGLISFVVYANTLKNGYALDDVTVISQNTFVTKGMSAIPEILSTPYRRGFIVTPNDFYRPLSLVTFAIEYQFFGNNPGPSHFFNILFFAGCVILLFLFLDQLLESQKTAVAFIATLLFALHPIHTEVVANIKSRDELLCFFFAFLSLNIFFKYVKTGDMKQLLAGSLCFFLAILAKETVATFLAVIPLIFFFYKNENKKRSINITVCSVIMVFIFLAIRVSVLNFYHADEINKMQIIDNTLTNPNITYSTRIATALLILGYYMKLLFVPYPLICDYSYNSIPYVSFSNPIVLISAAIYVFLAVYGIRLLLKGYKNPFAFGILFFLITLSLFTNILFLIGATMAERFMFFPSVGFCVVLGLLIEKCAGKAAGTGIVILKNKIVLGIITTTSIIYAVLTIQRNHEWFDNFTLYSADVKKAPNDCRLYYFLGSEYDKNIPNEKDPVKVRQIQDLAILNLTKAVTIYPEFVDAQTNLGATYFRIGQFDSSELHSKKVMEFDPTNQFAIYNLACAYFSTRRYQEATGLFRERIESDPYYVHSYINIGACYYLLNKYDSAIYFLDKAVSINPEVNASYEYLARVYSAKGLLDLSKKYQGIAKKNNPDFKL